MSSFKLDVDVHSLAWRINKIIYKRGRVFRVDEHIDEKGIISLVEHITKDPTSAGSITRYRCEWIRSKKRCTKPVICNVKNRPDDIKMRFPIPNRCRQHLYRRK
jgi:hypothetical protein